MDFIQQKYEEYQCRLRYDPPSPFSPSRSDSSSPLNRSDTPIELSPFSMSYDPGSREKCDVLFRCPVHQKNLYAGYNYTKFLLALLCIVNNISLYPLNLYLPYAVNWNEALRSLLPPMKTIIKPLPEFVGFGNSSAILQSIETSKTGIVFRTVDSLQDVSKIRRAESIYMYFHTGETILENKFNVNVRLSENFSINEFHSAVARYRKSSHFAKITLLLESTIIIAKNSPVPKFLQYLIDDLKYIVFEGKLYHANYIRLKDFFPPTNYFVLSLYDGRILTIKTHIEYRRYCDLPKILTEYY